MTFVRLGSLVCAVALVLTHGLTAGQARPQDIALQAAIRTETIDRDLAGAIAQYEAIFGKYRTQDRATAAKALLRLAECHRQLGRATAQTLFEQVISEFADQKDAVQHAQSRLAPSEPRPRIGERPLTTLPVGARVAGSVSYDGRLLAYVDWSVTGRGDLFVRTLATGVTRRITNTGNQPNEGWPRKVEHAAFTRDGGLIAYSWYDRGERRGQ